LRFQLTRAGGSLRLRFERRDGIGRHAAAAVPSGGSDAEAATVQQPLAEVREDCSFVVMSRRIDDGPDPKTTAGLWRRRVLPALAQGIMVGGGFALFLVFGGFDSIVTDGFDALLIGGGAGVGTTILVLLYPHNG
jgi:hypothetical protein